MVDNRYLLVAAALAVTMGLPIAAPVRAQSGSIAVFANADLSDLTDGVHEIAAPGYTGSLCVYGKDAFTVVAGKAGDKFDEPVVAAARLGSGRLVAFGHTGYLDPDAFKVGETAKLVTNALRWASGGKRAPRVGVFGNDALVAYLRGQGISAARLERNASFAGDDVVVGTFSDLPASELNALDTFVRNGGGALGAETGWGWQQGHPGAPLSANGANRVFGPAGLFFGGGSVDRTSANGIAVGVLSPDLNGSTALDDLKSASATSKSIGQAVWTLTKLAEYLPENDTILRPRLEALKNRSTGESIDLGKNPITMKRPIERLGMTLQVREEMSAPADKVTADPTAAFFPGSVPVDAARITRTVNVDTAVPEWHSTGLYAAPGDKITVTLPGGDAGKGLEVRIGAHTDELWDLAEWNRAPQITRTFSLAAPDTLAANAFGGPVYIVVPEKCALGKITVTVSGAVAAPYYVKGKTSAAEWRATLRNAPAPWAEMQADEVILTIPSSSIRSLDDPAPLMAYWDEVLDHAADLYSIPHQRIRQERYCTDEQISAGYMHSGYPIMTFLDVADTFANVAALTAKDKGNSWGFYHELGHNHQQGDWTWDGLGEVTNNLFSLYGNETINGITDPGIMHPAMSLPEQKKRLAEYLAAGSPYSKYTDDPWTPLTMFYEMRTAFGWAPFTKVFGEYRTLAPGEHPKTDEDKRDQFMVRFSQAIGRNLGPFFTAWGVPTSDAARKSIANLPAWMPADWPGRVASR